MAPHTKQDRHPGLQLTSCGNGMRGVDGLPNLTVLVATHPSKHGLVFASCRAALDADPSLLGVMPHEHVLNLLLPAAARKTLGRIAQPMEPSKPTVLPFEGFGCGNKGGFVAVEKLLRYMVSYLVAACSVARVSSLSLDCQTSGSIPRTVAWAKVK